MIDICKKDFESLDVLAYKQDQYVAGLERMDADKLHYIVSTLFLKK